MSTLGPVTERALVAIDSPFWPQLTMTVAPTTCLTIRKGIEHFIKLIGGIENQEELFVCPGFLGRLDDEKPGQAAVDLSLRIKMWVVPERAHLIDIELVSKSFTGSDR